VEKLMPFDEKLR